MLLLGRTWEWISKIKKTAASLPPTEVAEELFQGLNTDFEQAFGAIKSQKLLTATRSLQTVRTIAGHLIRRASELKISGKKRSILKRHCEASIFFQEAFDDLARRSHALEIWNVDFIELSTKLLTALEVTTYNQIFPERSPLKGESSSATVMGALEASDRFIRDRADHILMILNEGRKRCPLRVGSNLVQEEINEAIEVAQETERAGLIWDQYSFNDLDARIVGDVIHLDPLQASLERIQDINAVRVQISDIEQGRDDRLEIARLRREFAENVHEAPDEEFSTFCTSKQMLDFLAATTPARERLTERLCSELNDLVDIDSQFSLPAGHFTYRELIRFWICLYQISNLVQLWTVRHVRSGGELQPPVIHLTDLEALVTHVMNESLQKVRTYIRQFSSTRAKPIDLFYRPLLDFENGTVFIPITYIQMSRFDRNLIHILVSEVTLDVSSKGKRPLDLLAEKFRAAGFELRRDFPVIEDGRTVTDADLLAAKDNILFLFQCKILAVPDSSYEVWKNEQSLEFAAQQMRECVARIDLVLHQTGESLGLGVGCSVVPFLLTNVWTFTGLKIGGFVTTDISYLGNVLSGAIVQVQRMGSSKPVTAFKLIEGRYPSGRELDKLLSKPAHDLFLKVPGGYERESFHIGSKTAVVRVRMVQDARERGATRQTDREV